MASKAWTGGANPITQPKSSSSTSAANGLVNGNGNARPTTARSPDLKLSSHSAEKHAHDRLLYLYANLLGSDVVVNLKGGESFAGIFAGASTNNNEPSYLLKMVRKLDPGHSTQADSAPPPPLAGDGEDHSLAFNISDVNDLVACNVDLGSQRSKATNGSAFRTDVEISGGRGVAERELQKWEPDSGDLADLSLGNETSTGSGHGHWDQFAVNEKLYNVRSDYNEDLYTTTIDRSNPKYRQLEEKAERLAREIERDSKLAPVDSTLDEEDKYSGVRRETPALGKSGANAYVPPSKRPITAKPTVPGAPFDPAIISAQISRPDSSSPAASSARQPPAVLSAASDKNPAAHKVETSGSTTSTKAEPTPAPSAAAENGANIIRDVTDAFKQFNQSEKLRIQQQQRHTQQQRARDAKQEKSVRLNDLKKFSQNFKLSSRVPEDLVPILAKSKEKQDEIKAKAEQQAREKEVLKQPSPSPVTLPRAVTDQKSQHPVQSNDATADAPQMSIRTRSQQNNKAPNGSLPAIRGTTPSNQRGPIPFRTGNQGTGPLAPLPIPQSTPQPKIDRVVSPTSATSLRFNANAMEFRPNPSASSFTPGGPSADRSPSKRPSVASPAPAPIPASATATPSVTFFPPSSKKSKLAGGDWKSTTDGLFSTVLWISKQQDDQKRTQFAANGGFPQGYRTNPTWDVLKVNELKSYVDGFTQTVSNAAASPALNVPNGAMAHQHQLPLHLQNGVPPYHQPAPFFRSPSHSSGFQTGDNQRMQFSASTNSAQPSPRMGHTNLAFPGQPYAQGQGYPYSANGMSPGMAMRAVPGGSPYNGAGGMPMGGHMMVQQTSNGPYMGHAGFPSPGPQHIQPQFGGHPGQMGSYSSSPRGHAMSHQGSQQGHGSQAMYMPGQPMMMMPQHGGQGPMRYGQPQFGGHMGQSPYGMQHRTMSSGGYGQHLTPRQQHAMPHQPGGGGPGSQHSISNNGEDAR